MRPFILYNAISLFPPCIYSAWKKTNDGANETSTNDLDQLLQRIDELIAELSALRAEIAGAQNKRAASNITDQIFGLLPEATYQESDWVCPQ